MALFLHELLKENDIKSTVKNGYLIYNEEKSDYKKAMRYVWIEDEFDEKLDLYADSKNLRNREYVTEKPTDVEIDEKNCYAMDQDIMAFTKTGEENMYLTNYLSHLGREYDALLARKEKLKSEQRNKKIESELKHINGLLEFTTQVRQIKEELF